MPPTDEHRGAIDAAIRIAFSPLEALPEAVITDSGPVSSEFIAHGVRSLREAARWLLELPYGANDHAGPLAVFRDGCGTCTTKHAAVVCLGSELGVDIGLRWGLYELDGTVLEQATSVLRPAALPFVPYIHCFLEVEGRYVDLTQGNCTGKSRVIEDYLRVSPARVGDNERVACLVAAEELCRQDPRFAHVDPEQVLDVLSACLETNSITCPAPGRDDGPPLRHHRAIRS